MQKKISFVLLGILFSLSLVSAISIEIEMEESFGVGEEISFEYTIISDVSQEVEYIASVNCPSAPLALLDVKIVNLEANVPFKERHIYLSSVDESIVAEVKGKIRKDERVLVALDSNHSYKHVLREMELYSEIVSPGSYMVAMDGAQAYVWDIPNGKPEWKDDNPLRAIEEFVSKNKEFEIDEYYTRMKITSNPKGFLRRFSQEEMAGK